MKIKHKNHYGSTAYAKHPALQGAGINFLNVFPLSDDILIVTIQTLPTLWPHTEA
ncbi:MAG: hypothetical protein NUK65_09705 [Firmicutes bacterium]|nr:hypothetical protein [Bacillota bacterium]